jgi:A/G-specific adenine glycosylase
MSQIISKKIIAWYQKHQRELPWRFYKSNSDRDYKVLLSEFMLQQTKVSTVIPYFNKFYKKFCSINALSKSRITSVLKLWEGLGYYRRARNLHQTAKIIVKKHEGKVPDSFSDLRDLPGIGDYTASAILSIAKDKPFIGIDGNVKRVISRVFALKQNKKLLFAIEKKLDSMKVKKNSSSLMQGIMEIGALLCQPASPDCMRCPIRKNCKSYKKNKFNLASKKKINKNKYFYAFFSLKNKKILFSHNEKFNFLKGLVNLPLVESANKNYKVIIKENFKKRVVVSSFVPEVKYKMSNFSMYIKILILKNVTLEKTSFFWIPYKDIKKFTVSILAKKLLQAVNVNEK